MISRALLIDFVALLTPFAAPTELLARADTPTTPAIPDPELADHFEVTQEAVKKGERRLHLLSGDRKVRSYRISLGDNPVGHKLYEGDSRTREGDYTLDWRNPESDFYKSIHISYPSPKDRELAQA